MILIGRKVITLFGITHPQSRRQLSAWECVMKLTSYQNFNALKMTFPSVDYVGHRYTIFNICGNKYRLITEIDYAAGVVNLKVIWTHAEYSAHKNQVAVRRGRL